MQERVNGNEYRTTLVCVDDYRQGSFSGRLYNPYWKEGREFQNVMQFLREMEGLLDRMKLAAVLHRKAFLCASALRHRPNTCRWRTSQWEKSHFSAARDFPAECQLAGLCAVDGKPAGGELSQCAGAFAADGRRAAGRRHISTNGRPFVPVSCRRLQEFCPTARETAFWESL